MGIHYYYKLLYIIKEKKEERRRMSKFLDVFKGKRDESPPLWFMRQAGRYLPEYQEVRKIGKTFLDLCYAPDLAAKVTLQPIERFGLDAAIIFSDILVIPHALGQNVSFEEGKGPILGDLPDLHINVETLSPVYQTIRRVKEKLPADTPLIGFAGAPWTLALYMLEGQGSRDFAKAKTLAFSETQMFDDLQNVLVEAITAHLTAQVEAGADALQIFDTWAGLCPATHFERWVMGPTRTIVTSLRQVYPDIPIIGFPKGIGPQLIEYGETSGISGLSLDSSTPLTWANQYLSNHLILQGNLDPLLLVVGGDPLKQAIHAIHEQMKDRPYIFNLGHGIVPQTPVKHVEDCVKWVRALKQPKQLSSCSI